MGNICKKSIKALTNSHKYGKITLGYKGVVGCEAVNYAYNTGKTQGIFSKRQDLFVEWLKGYARKSCFFLENLYRKDRYGF